MTWCTMAIRRRLCLLFLGCLILGSAQTPQAIGQKLFRISGIVVRHGTNQPLHKVHVTIAANDHPDKRASVVTSDDGRFNFTEVPQGKFTLMAEVHGGVRTYQQDDQFSTGIAVGPGLDSEHIVFPLLAPTGLRIRVMDDEGDPVRTAQVWLFRKKVTGGWAQIELQSQGNTNSEGVSSFAHLEPGTYYVGADGRPWYAQPGFLRTDTPAEIRPPAELDVAYPITYYPASQDPNSAAPIEVSEGATRQIELTLRAVHAAHISIASSTVSAGTQQQGQVEAVGPGGIRLHVDHAVYSDMGNERQIIGVAPGNYIVSVSQFDQGPAGRDMKSLGDFRVRAGDDTRLGSPELMKTSVAGTLTAEGTELLDPLVVWLVQPANGQNAYCRVEHDRSFHCATNGTMNGGLAPGRYEVRLGNTGDLYIKSISAKGATLMSGLLDVHEGSAVQLSIVAAQGATKLDGVVMRNDLPLSGAMILLIPQSREEGLEIPRDQSDSDGTFTLPSVHPGRYFLVAIDNGHDLEYRNGKVIEPYLAQAQVIEMPLASTTQVRVGVQQRR